MLLVAALGVWGSIIYQFMYNTNDFETVETSFTVADKSLKTTAVDTASLLLNYRDPFLEKKMNKPSINLSVNHSDIKNSKKISLPAKPPWPELKYNGSISNNSANNKMALIKINGKDHILKEGESIEGLSINRIHPDSIVLAFMNTSKTIYK